MYDFNNFQEIENKELTLDKLKDSLNQLIRQGKVGSKEYNELVLLIDSVNSVNNITKRY